MRGVSTQGTRLFLVILATAALFIINYVQTGQVSLPSDDRAFLYQNGLLLIAFGTLLFEDKFTKPVDSFTNALVVIITLLGVTTKTLIGWDLIFAVCVFVVITSAISIFFGRYQNKNSVIGKTISFSYYAATFFGRAKVIFSLTFILALFSYYGSKSDDFLTLLLFWGFVILIEPAKLPLIIARLFSKTIVDEVQTVGKILRLQNPDLVLCEIETKDRLLKGQYFLSHLGNEEIYLCASLGEYMQGSNTVVKGLLIKQADASLISSKSNLQSGEIGLFDIEKLDGLDALNSEINLDGLVGLVAEDSRIEVLYFEYPPNSPFIEEGTLIEVNARDNNVLYQVVNANTTSQIIESNKHGLHIAKAIPLGIWDGDKGVFDKYGWVPELNSRVYLAKDPDKLPDLNDSHFVLGNIPGSTYPIYATLDDLVPYHLAVAGVTGTGKTTLSLRLISQLIKDGYKIFCVDITGDYENDLADLGFTSLSLDKETSDKLTAQLLEVEVGEFGAKKEKKVLFDLEVELRNEIGQKVKEFIESDNNLGLLQFEGVSNTSANIFLTEIYLSSVFNYAKENRGKEKYCLVLEEAHTVIPEVTALGVTDTFSRGIIGKISQIALQGRKYSVGLLVLTQRTANVTKTVLTQCNSAIVFNTYDKTSIDFFQYHFGDQVGNEISNLKRYHAVVGGKGFNSMSPVIVKIDGPNP